MSLSKFLYVACAAVGVVASAPDVSFALQDILDKAHTGPLYTYPTSLTQGIVPKGIHSHNDCKATIAELRGKRANWEW